MAAPPAVLEGWTGARARWRDPPLREPAGSRRAAVLSGVPAPGSPRLGPLPEAERVLAPDLLRGTALLGIVLVNLRLFRDGVGQTTAGHAGLPPADRAAEFLVTAVAEARSYPLFALLFGYGFTVLLERARRRGAPATAPYLRRLAGLFTLGGLHAALLFAGDVLAAYALCGLALLPAARWRERTPIRVAAALYAVGSLLLGGAAAALVFDDAATAVAASGRAATYADGSFLAVSADRLLLWLLGLLALPALAPTVVGAMLVGHWAARRRILHDPTAHRPLLRRTIRWGLPVGIATGVAGAAVQAGSVGGATGAAGSALHQLGGGALAAAYAALGALYVARGRPGRAALAVAAAGRFSLSNYLLQSLVLSLLLAGYGAGLGRDLGAAAGTVLVVGLWVVQVGLSAAWVRRHRRGPVESLLRRWTYGGGAAGAGRGTGPRDAAGGAAPP